MATSPSSCTVGDVQLEKSLNTIYLSNFMMILCDEASTNYRHTQPNESSWAAQCSVWHAFILEYSRAHKQWQLDVTDALETDLFWNKRLNRRLKLKDAVEVLDYMALEGSIEWVDSAKSSAIVYWRKPEDWANIIYNWIETTGQKNSVLTLYEISNGELTISQEFHGVHPIILRKTLAALVKRGAAQVFGSDDEMGVKFF
ncbi:ESCRT-II complex subunit-domain-containing protein [Geopyxis carbonaria]|nr:ESCRT-II complex subunit-domain-containing protein [Geopyxis carbonaria]